MKNVNKSDFHFSEETTKTDRQRPGIPKYFAMTCAE